MSKTPDIGRYLPRHYKQEYPKFVQFLQLTFEYLYREQNLSPTRFMELLGDYANNGFSEESTGVVLKEFSEQESPGSMRDQMDFTTKGRQSWEMTFGGSFVEFSGGEVLQFADTKPKELESMLADRGFENFLGGFSGGVKAIDEIRFFRLMKDLKSFSGSSKIIELFFSWVHEGEVGIEYPREKISTLDMNMSLDGENHLRDDAFYSEYSYLVKVFGEPKVYKPETFYEMYLEHFHPAGFGFYLQDSYPLFTKPFDFPVMMPSGIPGSYFGLSSPIEILEGDKLNIRIFMSQSVNNDLSGPIFEGFSYNGSSFEFNNSKFSVTIDGVVLESEIPVLKDNQFHQLIFEFKEPVSLSTFLKSETEGDLTGKMPISRIQHIRGDSELLDFRINTKSENGIASSHTGFKMLSQPKGLYRIEDKSGEVVYVSEDLEPGKTYLVFVNTSNAEGEFYFTDVQGGEVSAEILDFENVTSGLRRFVNEVLPNAQDVDGEPIESGVIRPVFPCESPQKADKNFWMFLKPDEVRRFVASPNGSKGYIQVVTWEVPDNILTFERQNEDFDYSGVWVGETPKPKDEDYYRLFVSVGIIEMLAERFEYQVSEKIPDIFGLGLTPDTLDQMKSLNTDMDDFLKNVLPNRMRDATLDEMKDQMKSLNTDMDDFLKNILPNRMRDDT